MYTYVYMRDLMGDYDTTFTYIKCLDVVYTELAKQDVIVLNCGVGTLEIEVGQPYCVDNNGLWYWIDGACVSYVLNIVVGFHV